MAERRHREAVSARHWQWWSGLMLLAFCYWVLASANAANALYRFEREVGLLETNARVGGADGLLPADPSALAGAMLAAAPQQLTAAALEVRARYALLQAAHSDDDVLHRRWLRQARDDLRVATTRRPAWPYAWSALAEVKATQASFDNEFVAAFANATRTGPHESRSLRRLLGIVLSHSGRMRSTEWQAAEKIVRRLAEVEPQLLIERVERDQQMDWLCGIADLSVTVQNACARYRAAAINQERS